LEYAKLFVELSKGSQIGLGVKVYADEVAERRIKVLEHAEVEHGFVYVAEKAWLISFLESNRSDKIQRYSSWVSDWFSENLREFSRETYGPESKDYPDYCWVSEIATKDRLTTSSVLENSDFVTRDVLKLSVFGSNTHIHPSNLIRLYEFMHDFEFILKTMKYPRKENDPPLDIIELEVCCEENPMTWAIIVRSEYGSVFDLYFANRLPVHNALTSI